MKEIWKDIKGFEGYYQVSNFGRVKSMARTITRSDGVVQQIKERILKPSEDGGGYLQIILSKNSKPKVGKIHILVAMTFLNHIPDGLNIVVDHDDTNKLNNHVGNLKLITHRENCSKDKIGYTSKHPGVCWDSNNKKYKSGIKINGKAKHLGYFTDENEAAKAYNNELKKLKNK